MLPGSFRATGSPKPHSSTNGPTDLAFAVYGSREYVNAIGGDLSRAHRWVGFDEALSHLQAYGWIRDNVDRGSIGFRSTSFMAVMEAVASGFGMGVLPCYLANERPELVRCSEVLPSVATDLWLLVHDDIRHAARVRAFVDFIVPEMQSIRPLLEC